VFSTYRKDNDALLDLKEIFPDALTLLQMDVADKASIEDAFKPLNALTDSIDILINNAGRYGSSQMSLNENFDIEDIVLTYRTNTLGPLLVLQQARPFLEKGADKKAIHISSKVGSIQDNESGGAYGYRASKTALNMMNKNMSIDLKDQGIASIVMHPGWVQTDMGGSNAPIDIKSSVTSLVTTIDQLSFDDSGKFFERDGSQIPW